MARRLIRPWHDGPELSGHATMILSAFFFNPQGDHRVSWRHPRAPDLEVYDIAYFQKLAAAAEAAKLDALFVADHVGMWERGSNRIGSSRLFEFAKVLDVPVSYFFDEMPTNALSGRPMSGRGRKGFGEAGTPFEQEKDPLIKRETLELVRAYYKIRESRVRKRIFEMVKAVGAASHAEVLGGRKGRKTRRASS
jgi:transcriptional regulator with XRE-family HTH domain